MNTRFIAWGVLAAIVAFGAGWVTGASGRSTLEQDRRHVEQRADLLEARALVLDGRVSLFLVNFGDASRLFEEARGVVERAQTGLREAGLAERAGRLEIVLSHLRDAQRMAASLDASAQAAAAEALKGLDALRALES